MNDIVAALLEITPGGFRRLSVPAGMGRSTRCLVRRANRYHPSDNDRWQCAAAWNSDADFCCVAAGKASRDRWNARHPGLERIHEFSSVEAAADFIRPLLG